MTKLVGEPVNSYRSIPQNIRFLITNPCAASPYIYLETLVPVVGKAVLELLTFGLSDILIGYARPKIPRGRPRWGKGEPRRVTGRDGRKRPMRGAGGLPELGNEIGKRLPGSRRIQSLTDNKIGHLIWLPIDIAQHIAYRWMIADITKDSIYEWASDIYTDSCKPKPGDKWATWDGGYSSESNAAMPVAWITDGTNTFGTIELHGMIRGGGGFDFGQNCSGFAFGIFTTHLRPGVTPGVVRCEILTRKAGGVFQVVASQTRSYIASQTVTWQVSARFQDQRYLVCRFVKVSGGFPFYREGTAAFMVNASP